MMRRASLGLVMAVFALVACGEKPQTAAGGQRKAGTPAWQGTGNAAFAANGWKAGDAAAWETQMRKRAQGQNEYSRATAQ